MVLYSHSFFGDSVVMTFGGYFDCSPSCSALELGDDVYSDTMTIGCVHSVFLTITVGLLPT